MPLASGLFTRLYSWATDRLNGVPITDTRMDDEFDGIATALSTALYKDGQSTPTANIPMGGYRLTNLGDPSSDTDALNRRSADGLYGVSTDVRLTLSSGIAVTDSDVTSAGTIYATPINNNTLGIYSGSAWAARTFAEVSLTLDATGHPANTNFYVFAYWDGSQVKIGTGPAWTSDTAVGIGSGTSEVEVYQGRLVNKNTITLRNNTSTTSISARRAILLGGFRTIGVAAQTEDSAQKRFLSNVFNAVPRTMKRLETTGSWNYSSSTVRLANANTANKLEFFQAVSGRPVTADVFGIGIHSSSGNAANGIGVDSATVVSDDCVCAVQALINTSVKVLPAQYKGVPGAGYHYLSWLEWSGTTATHTFYGDGMALGSPVPHQAGITGTVVN